MPHLIDRVPDADLACPSATQCTAGDGAGDEVTFDPQAPSQAAADVGHRIRVSVVAWNISGSSAPSQAKATDRVQLSLVVRSASIAGLTRGVPRLALSLASGPNGRRITRITILLPSGLTIRNAGGLGVRDGATQLAVATTARGRTITIALHAPSTGATVSTGPSELEASERLIRQSRSHRPAKLSLSLTVIQRDGGTWRLSLPLT